MVSLFSILRSDYSRFEQKNILHLFWRLFKYPTYILLVCFRLLTRANKYGFTRLLLIGLRLYYYHLCNKYSIELPIGTKLGKACSFPHGGYIVINTNAVIGDNVTLYPGVLIGTVRGKGVPTIGNNVFIGAGAKILGNIKIGDWSFICPNSVVVKDVESGSVVSEIPSKTINMNGEKHVKLHCGL